jgi:putative toxin-antitoxin system antitoxin component (TIGR02293 family)
MKMVNPDRIAEVMGGIAILGCAISSVEDLSKAISNGLPKMALRVTAKRASNGAHDVSQLVYKIVPEATYKRRTRLTPAESERTERLARVIATAEYVWDDQDAAHRWLHAPHPELGGRTPLQSAMTELGARQVEELLDKIFYGLSA